jgi:hypothetical protein
VVSSSGDQPVTFTSAGTATGPCRIKIAAERLVALDRTW